MSNSNAHGPVSAPFGYLKASTNLLSVNFFIMPYNYPVLLPLVDELKQDPKARTDQSWRMRLEKYLRSVPNYYMQVEMRTLKGFSDLIAVAFAFQTFDISAAKKSICTTGCYSPPVGA